MRKDRAEYQGQIAHLPADEQAEALREYDEEVGSMAFHSHLPIAGQLDQFLRVWLATDEIYNFDPEEIHAAERHLAAFKQRANAKAAALGEPLPFPET